MIVTTPLMHQRTCKSDCYYTINAQVTHTSELQCMYLALPYLFGHKTFLPLPETTQNFKIHGQLSGA